MSYYCKNCGAVVTGKYCSCCGTKVRSGLQEYRLAERRFAKKFREEKYASSGRRLIFERIADLSFSYATEKNVPMEALNEDAFDYFSDKAWDGLRKAMCEAEEIYGRIVRAIYQCD